MYRPIRGKNLKKPIKQAPDLGASLDSIVKISSELNQIKENLENVVENKLEEVDKVIEEVKQIKKGEDGRDGVDADDVDYDYILSQIPDPRPDLNAFEKKILAKFPKFDVKKLKKEILSSIPDRKADLKIIQESIEIDPVAVIDKIMALPEAKRKKLQLSGANISGYDQTISALRNQLGRGYLHGGGLSTVSHDNTMSGDGISSNPLSVTLALNDLTDVIAASPSTGQVLMWNGVNWINDNVPGGGGGSTIFKDQTPTHGGTYTLLQGTIDGANQVFTVSEGQYISGKLTVFVNGQELAQGTDANEWAETDPTTGTFTLVTPPTGTDIVYCEYTTTAGGGGGNAGGANTQVQFNDAGALNGDPTFTFNKTTNELTVDTVVVSDEAYGIAWDGSLEVPTKNALYDKIQSFVPTTITVANEATDTTCFPLFVTAATGDLGPKTNTSLTYNSNTSALTNVGTIAGLSLTATNQVSVGTADIMVLHGVTITSQIQANSDTQTVAETHTYSNTAGNSSIIYGARSRGTTVTPLVVQSGDEVARFAGVAYDGTDYEYVGYTAWLVGGTPGSNDMPGKYVIAITPDGGFTPVEALNIASTGVATFAQTIVGSITGNAGTASAVAVGGITGLGTGVATALAVNVGSAGAFVTFDGALGTPSSGTVTNLTGTASININGTVGATTPAAGTFTTAVANSFVPNLSTIPTNGMYLPAANTLGWAINSAAELQLTGTALSPAVDGGSSLGTTTLGWQNLFANTGFVLNIENGNVVVTHSSGVLSVDTGDLQVLSAGTNARSVALVGGVQTLTNKTLTAPKIANGGFIADANGNELIIFTTTASAVNELTLANGATGVNPKLTASGETNVGLDFQVKGTGVYRFLATASGPTDIRWFEDTDNGTNYVSLIAPATLASDVVLTLPSTTGTVAILGGDVWTGVHDFGGATSLEIPNGAGGTTVDATGEVTIDSTSRTLNFYDGTIEAVLTPIMSKSITIESPTAAEDISMFYTDDAITITKIVFVITGATSVTTTIRQGTDRSATGTEVVTGGTTANSTTTGNVVTSFNDATVPADSFIWLETTALSGTPTSLNVTIFYRQDA